MIREDGGEPPAGRTTPPSGNRGRPGRLAARARQARNPPPPVARAVMADLAVATIGGILLLLYDWLLARGARLPGGDLRTPATAAYVLIVLGLGSLLTYLWVALPTGAGGPRRRSGWAAVLGLLAAVPIAYLVLVVSFQVVRPLLG